MTTAFDDGAAVYSDAVRATTPGAAPDVLPVGLVEELLLVEAVALAGPVFELHAASVTSTAHSVPRSSNVSIVIASPSK